MIGFVLLGCVVAGAGVIGNFLILDRLAERGRKPSEDPLTQQYLRYGRFLLSAVIIGFVVALASAMVNK